jgi:putative protein-disulfide isomerase
MRLIYVADPMCSWCYGISDEVSKLKKSRSEKMGFQLILGGLRPYNTETIADLGEMLEHHWTEVQKRSGRLFNTDILEDQTFVYDTEPPSRAVVVMRNLNPKAEYDFFKRVQIAFYYDNLNTNDVKTYKGLVGKFNVDSDLFEERYNSESMKMLVRNDFQLASKLGVRGFPTLLLENEEGYHVISRGYAPFEILDKRVQSVLG